MRDVEDWFHWTKKAVQSIYGYEFQGDNLFLARLNIFLSVGEFFEDKFNFLPPQSFLIDVAEIISWNLWQMDGLKEIVPYSDRQDKAEQIPLLNGENTFQKISDATETGSARQNNLKIHCKIKDWKTGEEKIFANLGVSVNEKV